MKFMVPIFVLCYIKVAIGLFCYWNTGCPYKYFGSKTPYNVVRGDIRDSLIKLTETSVTYVIELKKTTGNRKTVVKALARYANPSSYCEPVSIWALIRHGKQNPSAENGRKMKDAIIIRDYVVSSYEAGNCSLCAQDVENLRNWNIDKGLFDKTHELTKEGYQELVGIGRRLRQAFPKLLSKLDKGDYTFRPGFGKWMEDSAKGFVEGLNKQLMVQKAKKDFDIMTPYVSCGKYQRDVKGNPDSYAEVEKYETNSEYLASLDRIQRRLGIDYRLSSVNITAIYDLCRYTSFGKEKTFSPWCALFTTEDLKVLEYLKDLKHYYRNGYGTPMNRMFGEIVLADLLKSFQTAKEGNGQKIHGYVTEDTMMDMAYTALNLFKDDVPLTGAKRHTDRKWRSSKVSVFSSNLIAVLNKCNKDGAEEHNVVFYLNEEPLIPICKEGVCSWEEFEDKLKPFLDTKTDFCE